MKTRWLLLIGIVLMIVGYYMSRPTVVEVYEIIKDGKGLTTEQRVEAEETKYMKSFSVYESEEQTYTVHINGGVRLKNNYALELKEVQEIKGGYHLIVEETEKVQSTAEELKEEIIDEWDYPIKSWEDAQNSGLDYQGWKDVCNPSEDVLHSLSTQELANLALRYPLIPWMPSRATDSEASVFIGAYGGSSTIFSELRNREDRNVCILEAYAENVPNVEEWDSYDAANWAEHFVEQYLFVFSKELTKEEREFYLKTVEEKKEKYYCNIEEPFVAPGLSFDEDGTARP